MARITRYPWISHFLGSPTGYVVHLQKGLVRHQGVGQAFWYRPANSVLSEVPVDDQELPTLFHAITRDHQDVSVQANVTYRFIDPVAVSSRLDFGLQTAAAGPATGKEQVATIIGQLCQSHAIDQIATTTLAEALERGVSQLRAVLTEALRADARLLSTGIEILGVQVLAVRPESDVERALQTPVREQLQAEADRPSTNAAPSPSNANGPSPKTRWQARSNWQPVANTWSPRKAPTRGVRRRKKPPRDSSRRRLRPNAKASPPPPKRTRSGWWARRPRHARPPPWRSTRGWNRPPCWLWLSARRRGHCPTSGTSPSPRTC